MRKTVHSAVQKRLRTLLSAARKRAGLTQAETAARLGKPQSFVAKYENGERRIDVLEFIGIARALGEDPVELFALLIGNPDD